jgi:hypothetical protein
MSNLVIPALGAAAGFFVGGPTGAMIGWTAGSAYQTSQETIEQDSIADVRIQTASYGQTIPMIVGRQRISGNVIWRSEEREYSIESQGGKGGPTTVSTGYKVDLCIALCEGEILGVGRVWANEEILVNAGGKLPGTVYTGTNTQNPDPTMEALEGVGNVPAYRGLAYIMIEDYDLGVGGQVPQFSFEVIKNGGL